jgi:DNA-binding transcriptional ArsR family regulator
MPEKAREPPIDYATLASNLSAVSYPVRLELLDRLRFPHTLAEIKVAALRGGAGSPEHLAARETVRAHLDKLVDVELVHVEQFREEGRTTNRYSVNLAKLYGVVEELRRVSTMYAGQWAGPDATGTLQPAPPPAPVQGPRLVLVHGAYEGKSFPLDARTAQDGQWVIGRKRGIPVSLEYDPYVSLENSAIMREGSSYVLTDLEGSKNGTALNWVPLAKGLPRELRASDVIGVGRSLLVFAPT